MDISSNPQKLSVSIVINVFNAEELIGKFLESLSIFKGQDFELVIVDDGSTDRTVQIIESYTQSFKIRLEKLPHVGLVPARAHGVEIASGEVIIILDVDEIIDDKDLLQKFLEPFADPTVGAVGGNIRSEGWGLWIEAQRLDRQFRQMMRKSGKQSGSKYYMGGVVALRKYAVIAVGGINKDPRIVEDTDLSIRLRKNGWRIINRDDIVVGHPDPDTLAGIFKKAVLQGKRIVQIARVHPREVFTVRFALLYAPIWILLLTILSWKFAVIIFLVSFLLIQGIYSRMKSTFTQRTMAWMLLYINSLGISLGTIRAFIK